MTTLNEMIDIIKAENPNGLRAGSDETGYIDLTLAEYEAQVAEWAANRLEKLAKLAEAEAEAQTKLDAVDKLTALGLTTDDLKALGLGTN